MPRYRTRSTLPVDSSPDSLGWVIGVFCVCVLALLTFGFVVLMSTCPAYAAGVDSFYYAQRQALWLGLGLVVCGLTARVDYRHYRKYAWPLFFAAVFLLAAVLIFGKRINGATRWFAFGPIRFQPSEFAKYALIIILAFWLERTQRGAKGKLKAKVKHWWFGVFAPLSLASIPAALIVVEPDLGTTLLLGSVTLSLMWMAGSPGGWLTGILVVCGGIAVAFLVAIFQFDLFQDSYQVQRILHWWREDDLDGSNYQQYVAMLALGSGGPDGLGLGNSRMKLGFLPEAHTDFIFPIAGEELGLVATLAVVAAFMVLVLCGLKISAHSPDLFGTLLGSGIVVLIGFQAMINIAVSTNSVPNKGMSLPFISYGGSNLVMTLAAVGVLLNVFRQCQEHVSSPKV